MASSLFRSFFSHWFGLALTIIIGFFVSPFVVHSLGQEQYGILVLVVSIAGQFIILDFGIGYSLTKKVAAFRSEVSPEKMSAAVSSAIVVLVANALLAFCLLYLLSGYLPLIFKISPEHTHLLRAALIISGIDVAFGIIGAAFQGTLSGSERYDLLHSLNVGRVALNALILLVVLSLGVGILGVAATALSARVFYTTGLYLFAFSENPKMSLRFSFITFDMIKQLVAFGFWVTIIVCAVRVISHIDCIIIGFFISASAVTLYAIPLLLVDQLRMFTQSGMSVLLPRFSSLVHVGDHDTTRMLMLKWATFGQIICLAIGVPLLVTGGDFIRLWMGPDFEGSVPILRVLTVPFLFTVPALAFGSYLYASEKHFYYAKLQVFEAVCNLALSIVLVRLFGLMGVAFGTLIPAVLFSGFVMPYRVSKMSGMAFSRYLREGFLKPFPVAIFHFCALLVLRQYIGADTWISFILTNMLGLMAFSSVALVLCVTREDRAYLFRRIGLSGQNS